jgi:hypothetical protein
MAPRRASIPRGAGALLALGFWFVSPASAAPEVEDARSAAPASCVAEQFALRSYVMALQSGDVTSGARDPERIAKAITPLCQQAIDSGRWPGLANELLAHSSDDEAVKRAICAIAPPEAGAAIAEWETADEKARASYDVPCAVALFRHRPEDFARVVVPRLGASGGCAFPSLAARLGEAVGADERIRLLPTLEFATRTRADGRDRLYEILCQHPAARTQAVCQSPPVLERAWAHEARIHRAAPWIAFHVGLSVLFALGACLLRYFRGKDWPASAMSVVATAATAAALAWIVASAPAPGDGVLSAMKVVAAMVAAPVAALVGGLLAWALVSAARGVALAWCLLQAVVYAVVTAVHAWTTAWDRLC